MLTPSVTAHKEKKSPEKNKTNQLIAVKILNASQKLDVSQLYTRTLRWDKLHKKTCFQMFFFFS